MGGAKSHALPGSLWLLHLWFRDVEERGLMVTQLRENVTEQLKSPNYSLSWVQVPAALGSISHHPLGSTAPAVPWRHLSTISFAVGTTVTYV